MSRKVGTRHQRKIKKYSENFNRMFNFFLSSYRKDLITFCGSNVEVFFDVNGISGKECFRLYDDGFYKKGTKPIITRHPNIVKSVIIGKKSWGLWLDQWTDGINEWCFTKEEILNQFEEIGIVIPEPLILDFNKTLERKRLKRIEEYLNNNR